MSYQATKKFSIFANQVWFLIFLNILSGALFYCRIFHNDSTPCAILGHDSSTTVVIILDYIISHTATTWD